ncbi:MAG: DegT/DnrJ/EryC1/StrS aminotransferase family protein [Candidatus Woesearchaeota archaeon]|nr:MAG: DegT/DnrJ/EryC1/StrS aminotransferase family protein [Candidatus Woesearchaeota archaeon]
MLPKYAHHFTLQDYAHAKLGFFRDYAPKVSRLLEGLTGYSFAHLLHSGRSCLSLTFAYLNFPQGSYVALPVNTCEVVVEVILAHKLIPLFVDVNENLTLDVADLEKKSRGKQVRAVIAVTAFGNSYDKNKLNSFVRTHNAILIEDKAQTVSFQKNPQAFCSFFSLDMAKYVSTIKGGVLLTNDKAFAAFVDNKAAKHPRGFSTLVSLIAFSTLTAPVVYSVLTKKISGLLKSQLFYAPKHSRLSGVATGLLHSQFRRIRTEKLSRKKFIEAVQKKYPQHLLNNNPEDNLMILLKFPHEEDVALFAHRSFVDLPQQPPLLTHVAKYKPYWSPCPVAEDLIPRVVLIPTYARMRKRLQKLYELLDISLL